MATDQLTTGKLFDEDNNVTVTEYEMRDFVNIAGGLLSRVFQRWRLSLMTISCLDRSR